MTKHTMVTFQLHRKGVILIAVLAVIVAVLLVAAGYLAAALRPRPPQSAPSVPAVKKPAAPAAPKVAPKPELFTLRVALLTTEEEAQAEVKRLAVKKLKATVVPAETGEGAVIYEVHVGSYAGRAAAAKAAAQVQKEHGLVAAVVPAP